MVFIVALGYVLSHCRNAYVSVFLFYIQNGLFHGYVQNRLWGGFIHTIWYKSCILALSLALKNNISALEIKIRKTG